MGPPLPTHLHPPSGLDDFRSFSSQTAPQASPRPFPTFALLFPLLGTLFRIFPCPALSPHSGLCSSEGRPRPRPAAAPPAPPSFSIPTLIPFPAARIILPLCLRTHLLGVWCPNVGTGKWDCEPWQPFGQDDLRGCGLGDTMGAGGDTPPRGAAWVSGLGRVPGSGESISEQRAMEPGLSPHHRAFGRPEVTLDGNGRQVSQPTLRAPSLSSCLMV